MKLFLFADGKTASKDGGVLTGGPWAEVTLTLLDLASGSTQETSLSPRTGWSQQSLAKAFSDRSRA